MPGIAAGMKMTAASYGRTLRTANQPHNTLIRGMPCASVRASAGLCVFCGHYGTGTAPTIRSHAESPALVSAPAQVCAYFVDTTERNCPHNTLKRGNPRASVRASAGLCVFCGHYGTGTAPTIRSHAENLAVVSAPAQVCAYFADTTERELPLQYAHTRKALR